MIKKGDRVTYVGQGVRQRGIVKSVPDARHVFVVYHCGEKWHQYENYAAENTRTAYLLPGWCDEAPEMDLCIGDGRKPKVAICDGCERPTDECGHGEKGGEP